MAAKTGLERAIEATTGESGESRRNTPILERRKAIERRRGCPVRFLSLWPFIGRGSIMHGATKSRRHIDADVDEALVALVAD